MRSITFTGMAPGGDNGKIARRPMRFDTGMYGELKPKILDNLRNPKFEDESAQEASSSQRSADTNEFQIEDSKQSSQQSASTDDEDERVKINREMDNILKGSDKIKDKNVLEFAKTMNGFRKQMLTLIDRQHGDITVQENNRIQQQKDELTKKIRAYMDSNDKALDAIMKEQTKNIVPGNSVSTSTSSKQEGYHLTTRQSYSFLSGAFESDYGDIGKAKKSLCSVVNGLVPTNVAAGAKGTEDLDAVVSNDQTVNLPDGKNTFCLFNCANKNEQKGAAQTAQQKPKSFLEKLFGKKDKKNDASTAATTTATTVSVPIPSENKQEASSSQQSASTDDSKQDSQQSASTDDSKQDSQQSASTDDSKQDSQQSASTSDSKQSGPSAKERNAALREVAKEAATIPDKLNYKEKDVVIPTEVNGFTITGNSKCCALITYSDKMGDGKGISGFLVISNGTGSPATVNSSDPRWKAMFRNSETIEVKGFAIWDVDPGKIDNAFGFYVVPVNKESFSDLFFDEVRKSHFLTVILVLMVCAIAYLAYKIFIEVNRKPGKYETIFYSAFNTANA